MMGRRIQSSLDGISWSEHRVRSTGTVVIEEEDARSLSIGEVGVAIVVFHVDDVNAKLDKEGDLARVAVAKTTDFRIVDEELKKILVERLGLEGIEPVLITPDNPRIPRPEPEVYGEDPHPLLFAVNDNGELESVAYIVDEVMAKITGEPEDDERAAFERRMADQPEDPGPVVDEDDDEDESPVILGNIHDRSAAPSESSSSGVKVAPFSFLDAAVPESRETVARVRQTKDPVLAKGLALDELV